MGPLDEFLGRLLNEGRIVFQGRPEPPSPAERAKAAEVLGRAFATYRLDVAGPPVAFEPAIACAAGELVRQAAWAVVNRAERVEDLGRRLAMPRGPKGPSDHLSADLVLRYLPQVLRRARAIDPSDPPVAMLGDVLRQWPLSGVLADLHDGPTAPVDLGAHPGLLLLYAERWARHERPAWRPAAGRASEYLELVTRDRPAAGAPRRGSHD